MRGSLLALVVGALTLASTAQAQDWPTKQVTIVVPFGAGGSADLLARILATHMQAKSGIPVVVENRAGAGGSIGTGYVTKATPDGTTLLLGTVSSIAVNAALYPKLPFDVDRVPSFGGEPICKACLVRVNARKRARGLPEWRALPGAYPLDEPVDDGD